MEHQPMGVKALWARLRFSVVAGLLASPPARGELQQRLQKLADQPYRNPVTHDEILFGFSTIERWYYQALKCADPVAQLARKVRKDAGETSCLSAALLQALAQQYREHPSWSYKLHVDNLLALVQEKKDLGAVPSYSTIRRAMKARGWRKQPRVRRHSKRATAGQIRAAERLEKREVRSFEMSHVHALWHLDFHHGSLRVVDSQGIWHTPQVICILDDYSRLGCHLQWYLRETAEELIHALCQAFAKRGLPRAIMMDNGGAMVAQETKSGLARLGVLQEFILPYSPYQNAKQESFWGQLEGRLMSMLEKVKPLRLDFLNKATQAWLELEYNRAHHSEIGTNPLSRFLAGPEVSRPCPSSEALKQAFTIMEKRKQRHSDGTFTLGGTRFEVPSHLRTLDRLWIRYASWDKTVVSIVDERTGVLLAQAYPQDKANNADGRRRAYAPIPDNGGIKSPTLSQEQDQPIPPLLRKYLATYAMNGLPPAYLPKDEDCNDFGSPCVPHDDLRQENA